jgi:hypothetical protein
VLITGSEFHQSSLEIFENIHRAEHASHNRRRDIATSSKVQNRQTHQNRQTQSHVPRRDSTGNGGKQQVLASHIPSPSQKSP